MRLHILGLVSLNGGDAAIMAGQEVMLRRQWPDVEVVVSDSDPIAAARYNPNLRFQSFLMGAGAGASGGRARLLTRFRVAHWLLLASLHGRGLGLPARVLSSSRQRRLLEPLLAADVIAYTGGTSLTENYSLRPKILDLEVSRRLRKTLVFLPQSAGPFRQPRNRAALARVFADSALVVLRDARSLEHVLEVGAPRDVCLVLPDMGFALARDPASWNRGVRDGSRPRVAVSVRPWSHFHGLTPEQGMARYVAAVREAVVRVVRAAGADVVLVSTCQGRPEYWVDDSALAATVAEDLPEDVRGHVRVDRQARSPEELLDVLATFDVLLATRLHAAILAACVGVPAVTVAYEYKTREVWRQLGLEEWVVDIEDVEPEALAADVLGLLSRRHEVVAVLEREVPRQKEGALSVGPAIACAHERRRGR